MKINKLLRFLPGQTEFEIRSWEDELFTQQETKGALLPR